jgi:spore coat polysaccharide biosynthesis protein SpsF
VATSDLPTDDPIAALAEDAGVDLIRGSESDVLARFGLAFDRFQPNDLVRLTGDCPLSDPLIVANTIDLHRASRADYTSNVHPRSFPKGLDVEVVTADAFSTALASAEDPFDREHVTPYLYRRPNLFRVANLDSGRDLGDVWWTVDTPEDMARIRRIVDLLEDPVTAPWTEILDAVEGEGIS